MRTFVLLVLLLTTGLSGCTEATDPMAGPSSTKEPAVITSPDDFSDLDDPSRGHVHDYWNGETERVLMDTTFDSSNFLTLVGDEWLYQYLPPLDDGVIVPQGTGHLRIQVRLLDDERTIHGDGETVAHTPHNQTFVPLGPLEEEFEYTVPAAEADLPHQAISSWEFALRFHFQNGMASLITRIQAHIVAVRGPDPLPVWPDHPDQWKNTTERPLFEGAFLSANTYSAELGGCSGVNGCPSAYGPDMGIVVPYDADHVDVWLESAQNTAALMTLNYHGADTRTWLRPDPIDETPGSRQWRLDVETQGDGPYATTSLWKFWFLPETVGLGTFTVHATVYRYPEVGPEPL